jgi:hypothetical protein
MGRNSTDFNTSGNWSNTTIPSTNDDIAFAQTPSSDLYLDADRTITNYYNYSSNSKKLIVNGKKLIVKGSINHGSASINAAGSSASPSEVQFAGSSAQSIAASTFVGDSAYKININNAAGVTLNGALKVNGEVAPTSGVFATNNNLTLRSYSVTNTAVVSAGSTSGGYITGEVTVERYFPPRRAFRLITSPVTTTGGTKPSINANWQEGQRNSTNTYSSNSNTVPGYGTHITGPQGYANGFDVTQSTNSSLFVWDNATQSWSAITNTLTNTITAGSTYRLMIRGDRSIDYNTNTPTPTYTILRTTGTLAQGDQTTLSLNGTASTWNIIGNPFQSQVDMESVARTNLQGSYQVWDPQMGTRGAYVTYTFGGGGSNNLSSAVNQYIQPGQSVFMQTSATATASVKFNEAHKNNSTTFSAVHRTASLRPKLYASLNYTDSLANNASAADGFAIVFDDSFSAQSSDDAPKLGNLDENFSILHSGKQYAMELYPMPVANDSFPIYINQYTSQQYTIRLTWANAIAGGPIAYLVDTYTKTQYPVSSTGNTDVVYSIDPAIAATKNANRFVIVFKNNGALPLTAIEVNALKVTEGVKINWLALNEKNVKSYDIQRSNDGRNFDVVGSTTATGNNQPSASYSWLDKAVSATTYYRIKSLSEGGGEQYSPIVKVQFDKNASATVNITPNPISDGRLQIQLNNFNKGSIAFAVFDAVGKKLVAQSMTHNGGSSQYGLTLPVNTAKGIYYLKISGDGYSKTVVFKVD